MRSPLRETSGSLIFPIPPWRILLVISLLAAVNAVSLLASDLEQKLALARVENDPHAEIELLRRWLDTHPDDPAAREELVGLWLKVSDFDMALQTLRQIPSPDPGLVARTHAEVACERDEKLPDAVEILRARFASAPKDRATGLMLAQYLKKAGERKGEIVTLDALLAGKSDFALQLDRADAKLAVGDAKGALADFRQAAAEAPDEVRVQNSRVRFERLESALAAISLLDKGANDPLSHFNKSALWFYAGIPSSGLDEALKGLRSWPNSVYGKILETRGLVSGGLLSPSQAREDRHIDVSVELEDENARQGILQADAALVRKPDDLQLRINRASWLNYSGHYALGMEDLAVVLKADPTNISALHYAAANSIRQGKLSAGTAYAEKLRGLKAPREVLSDVYAGLAELALEQSQLLIALEFAQRSLDAKPLPGVWKVKAACHTRLGQSNEAAEALKQAEKKGSR